MAAQVSITRFAPFALANGRFRCGEQAAAGGLGRLRGHRNRYAIRAVEQYQAEFERWWKYYPGDPGRPSLPGKVDEDA